MAIENKSVEELMRKADQIPPLPAIASRALRMMRNPDFSMKELADLLATDVTISSTLLRWANSSFYSLATPVTSIQQAVNYLGAIVIRSLVLSAALLNYLDKPVPGYNLDKGELWRHSLCMAVASRMLMGKYGTQIAEEAYTAGLLCDFGKLVFEVDLREANLDIPELEGKNFSEVELHFFGMDHAEMGAELAKRWEFPEPLRDAITYHHYPSNAPSGSVLPSAVHLADQIATRLHIGVGIDGKTYKLDENALKRLGQTEESLEGLLPQVLMQFDDIAMKS